MHSMIVTPSDPSCQHNAITHLKCYRRDIGSLTKKCYRREVRVAMSLQSRKEFMQTMRVRYQSRKSRSDKSRLIDQVCDVLQCHRKHAIRTLNQKDAAVAKPIRRPRPLQYQNANPRDSQSLGGPGLSVCRAASPGLA